MAPHRIALPHIEVGTFETGICHVDHMSIPQQFIAHTYAAGVSGKTHGNTAGAHLAAPKVGTHRVLKVCRYTPIGAFRIFKAFIDYA